MPFLIIFILLPIAEIYAFIAVGNEIGALNTILLCILTAAIGGYIVRQQGLEALFKAQQSIRSGQLPMEQIFDGFCLVIAGAMLLTPGFVTDTMGFLLLIPAVRKIIRQFFAERGTFNVKSAHYQSKPAEKDVIEADYEEIKKDQERLDQ